MVLEGAFYELFVLFSWQAADEVLASLFRWTYHGDRDVPRACKFTWLMVMIFLSLVQLSIRYKVKTRASGSSWLRS